MQLHEFQAREILMRYGIPFLPAYVISTPDELKQVLNETGWSPAVLKAQIHAGGRGKSGGVYCAADPSDLLQAARRLLGSSLITPQTGPHGMPVNRLLVSPQITPLHEHYLGVTIDRTQGCELLIASDRGGVDIEQLARESPEQITFLPIPSDHKLRPYHLIRLAHVLGWKGKMAEQGSHCITALVQAFVEWDATLIELNPLVQTSDGDLAALDVKCVLDDNALYRHPESAALCDLTQLTRQEAAAWELGLSYVALEGEIGCMVNGAGLAMATMDLIVQMGGHPANFLDIGGGASQQKIAQGLELILSDRKVKAILINVFGGITSCETLARGILSVKERGILSVPLCVRLVGTEVAQARNLLYGMERSIHLVEELEMAVKWVIAEAAACQS